MKAGDKMSQLPEGYELPVFRFIAEPMLLMGCPRDLIILNFAIGAIFILALSTFMVLPINILLHYLTKYATKQDPEFFNCLKRHIWRKDYYGV